MTGPNTIHRSGCSFGPFATLFVTLLISLMRFFLSFLAALVVILLVVRFKPQTPPDAEPIIPTQLKEASGRPDEQNATPAPPSTNDQRDNSKDSADSTATPSGAALNAPRRGTVYGAALTATNAQPISKLFQLLGTRDSAHVKLTGKAASVCQAKGCWLTMATSDGQAMRVKFKDYAFFVPKNITGKTVVVEGWARREVVPVDYLKHYERDAGKSEKEIAAITKPQQQVNFLADGVLVQND
jgi:cytoskeletal protein RodZ